jgi:flagellar biosynthetic protein FliO
MKTAPAAFAAALFALLAPAAPARSLYAAPPPAASESPAGSMGRQARPDEAPAPPTAAMEEKFRKLQKEMEARPKAPAPAPSAEAPRDPVSLGSLALQILSGLALVLVLAVAAIRVLKRMQGRLLARSGPGGDLLEVLETCHLGPQQKVVAVRMHDQVGILGVSKEGISMLATLRESAAEIRGAHRAESNPAAFSDNLNKLLERFKKPKKVSDLLEEAEG